MNGWISWLSIEDEGLVRAFIVGLVLMTVCASLLGVMLGWKLRNREVLMLKRRVRIQRLQLSKRQAQGSNGKTDEMLGRVSGGNYEECGAIGPDNGVGGRMRCSKPAGHDLKANGGPTKHGYAGVFWE